jgi:radical SAM superfamily enzyme YgiQ (UPF0313 family)
MRMPCLQNGSGFPVMRFYAILNVMDYIGSIFRPPAEHDSMLLQVTIGCLYNRCLFCGMYGNKSFAIKPPERIRADIEEIRDRFPETKRIFLCDGDALSMPVDTLSAILRTIRERLPEVRRVGAYAGAHGLKAKSIAELRDLRDLGLKVLYFGLETGDDRILSDMRKGADRPTLIREARKIIEAGIKCSVTVLLGIGGEEHSGRHAVSTGKALSEIDPDYIGALSLMIVPGTALYGLSQSGKFILPGPVGLLKELRTMVENTEISSGVFSANHASNYLPLQAHFPAQKRAVLDLIDAALSGHVSLKPEYLRGL